MARRISSLFSASDPQQPSPPPPANHTNHPPSMPRPSKLTRNVTPELTALSMPSTVVQEALSPHHINPPPSLNPSLLTPSSHPSPNAFLPHPGPTCDPQYLDLGLPNAPYRSSSPDGARPGSRGNGAGSQASSLPPSRNASPSRFMRPVTPDEQKQSKRLSWLPGRGGNSASAQQGTGLPKGGAWVVTPRSQENIHYDLTPLVNFQRVKCVVSSQRSVTDYRAGTGAVG